eukprot:TRINITY_DN31713_c0_g1_i1.p1 TRINITY_DN31713_c0_g1~~TRINITY_DN31713_c0_g1_i1.p1  ORF type:complete len:418 (+),score=48.82 TRINITY_DN31713_c0_g1_i1:37-1254(+)
MDDEPAAAESGDGSLAAAKNRLKSINITWAKSHLPVLRRAIPEVGLRAVESPCAGECCVPGDVVWVVTADDVEKRLANLREKQWLSHIPGIGAVCTKQGLAEALAASGQVFAWAPKTWCLPKDSKNMLTFCEKHPRCPLVYKPSAAGMGEAVFLMLGHVDAERKIGMMKGRAAIAQRYIERPLLIDGRKCDLRLYVLVVVPAAGMPWHSFLFREGLVRICVQPYTPPSRSTLHHTAVHLTNTAVSSLQADGSSICCTETLAALATRLGAEAWAATWQEVLRVLQQTLECCQPRVPPSSCSCFQIIGADVLLDDQLAPHLLELNDLVSLKLGRTVMLDDPVVRELGLKKCTAPCFDHRPHAHAPSDLDELVKVPLVVSSLRLVQRIHSRGGDVPSHALDGLPFDAL